MKSLIKQTLFTALLAGASHAATVTVTIGLGGTNVQGIRLSTAIDNSVVLNSSEYYVGVGRYNSVAGTFTPWATMTLDTATGSPTTEISGTWSTQNSISSGMDGQKIQIFAGVIASVPSTSQGVAFTPTGLGWVVFETIVAADIFPVVTGVNTETVTLNGPVSAFSTSGVNVVATADPVNDKYNGSSSVSGSAGHYYYLNTVVIPEPSTALLGAIGALGLLRRRRN